MKPMAKWERIEATIQGAEVDRTPLSFWRHYAVQEWAPGRLAELALSYYKQFDLDLIKLTPSGFYPLQDWGPTIRFSRDDTVSPEYVEAAVTSADEWENLPRLNVKVGSWGRELETLHQLSAQLNDEAPLLMTIYSPLTIASFLCWDRASRTRVIQDLREAPQKLHAGLTVIRDVVLDYVDACLEAGATGFFFGAQMANYGALTREEYEEFGVAYDLPILEKLRGKSRVTMLHVCSRQELMFDLMATYPVDIIHWADRHVGPSLAEARQITDKTISGGLSTQTLLEGSEQDVLAQARDAIEQAGRTRFMLGPSCVVNGRTPEANLAAARRAVEETKVH
jgi:uroporphyrinogen decarboxylase